MALIRQDSGDMPADEVPQTSPSQDAPTVLVGVTGCIAAYKACEVVRGLQKAGCRVKVVMTEHATDFVGTATFKALTNEPVAVSLFDSPEDPIHHISLAKEADLFVIAPATANVIAKLATGVADDLLTTTALATHAQILIAPAMNTTMWESEHTRDNVTTLLAAGVEFCGPQRSGTLACGDEGAGKLETPERIVEEALAILKRSEDLSGKEVLVTAGPTQEPLDPVRYLGNRSSGKMGYALAAAAASRGAHVTLVSGPTGLLAPYGVDLVQITTALEMYNAAAAAFATSDIAFFTAAVADYRPDHVEGEKMKKVGESGVDIHLVQNPDILATLAGKSHNAFVVGFCAETQNLLATAKEKLTSKHADMIVANDVSEEGIGFGSDENEVIVVQAGGTEELPRMSKRALAHELIDEVIKRIRA